ncbi:hypothetical protein D3C80_1533620 [compost metagenome]
MGKEGDGQHGNADQVRIGEIHQDDRHPQHRSDHQWQLAGEGHRIATTDQQIGDDAGEQNADRRAHERQHGKDPGLDHGQLTLFDQIRREPGQKEVQRGSAGELTDTNRPDLPVAEQLSDLPPVEFGTLLTALDQATAGFDVLQLFLADFLAVQRITVQVQPDHTENDAECTGAVKNMSPVIGGGQP